MSVLSLPLLFPRSPSPCCQPLCTFLSARFLRERWRVLAGVTRVVSTPARARDLPAIVLEALLEAPSFLLGGLPAHTGTQVL